MCDKSKKIRIKFTHQLLAGYGLVILLMVGISLLGYTATQNSNDLLGKVVSQRIFTLALINHIQSHAQEIRLLETELTKLTDFFAISGTIEALEKKTQEIEKNLKEFSSTDFFKQEGHAYNLMQNWELYKQSFGQTTKLVAVMKLTEADANSIASSRPRYHGFSNTLNQISERTETLSRQEYELNIASLKLRQNIFLWVSGMAILFGIFFITVVSRSLSSRIMELRKGAMIFAKGDMNHSIPLKHNDEITDLAASFNEMRDNIKKRQEALRQSEENYRTLFENLQDLYYRSDLAGNLVMVSPSIKKMLGYDQAEAISTNIPKNMYRFPQQSDVFMERLKTYGSVQEFEMELIRKDGSFLWGSANSHFWLDKNGNILGIEGMVRDISERKKAEEALREAQEELIRKEKLSVLGQLAGTVSHELRNPLGVMNNAVYFLKMVMTEADESIKEYLDIIQKEIANSQRIITDLLDFARTKTPLLQSINIRELVNECSKRCLFPVNVVFQVNIPESIPSLKIDPLQIGQVLQNLMANGIQAMPDGGTLTVATRLAKASDLALQKNETPATETDQGDCVEISVSDTGGGISTEGMKRLFQPLFTTKAKGIGLGLTLCKNLTEANGGKIEVTSQVGKGTNFTMVLPVWTEG